MNSPSAETDSSIRKPWRFLNRWRIEGCLFTLSPLHTGNGAVIHHPCLTVDDQPVEVNALLKDCEDRPVLSGGSIKGCLRAWGESRLADKQSALIREVFGRPISSDATSTESKDDGESIEGGRACFQDAPLVILRAGQTHLPFWNGCNNTYIEANNSIDRCTRTAADEHLLYTECVPAGVGFHVSITGCFNKEVAAFIIFLLSGFNDEDNPVLIGADTANGKGRCRWELGRVYHMDQEAAMRWIKNENRAQAEIDLPEFSSQELVSLRKDFTFEKAPVRSANVTTIDITLSFKSHFLVNDPPQKSKNGKEKGSSDPDMRPLVDEINNVILPAKSFRGAFRSQAEKILRTLDVPCCDIGKPCNGVTTIKDVKLCPACRVFGATGWASLLSVSDFKLIPGDYEFTEQEFIAIDRFTGGGKAGAKFKAKTIYKPRFQGRIELDLERLLKIESSGENTEKWALALIALTLRDLKEGDITFGYGAAKGYGTCEWITEGSIWEGTEFRNKVRDSMVAFKRFIEKEAIKAGG